MAKRKSKKAVKRTEAELKEALWSHVLLNTEDPGEMFSRYSNPTGFDLLKEMQALHVATKVTIPGFVVNGEDAAKIAREVEGSCLSDEAKKAVAMALKGATRERP